MSKEMVRVLVVDDSALMRKLIPQIIERDSSIHVVGTAMDGEFALKKIEELRPHVITLDLEMPRMDGFELIASVQGNLDTEDLPIIAITGHDELQARVHDCGGLYGIFKKPWNDRDLLRRVGALATLPRMQAVRSA